MPKSYECISQKLLPALAARGVVIFPGVPASFEVHRPESVASLQEAVATDKKIFIVTQRDASVDQPGEKDLYSVGTIARIKQSLRLPNHEFRVVVEGTARAEMIAMTRREKSGAIFAEVLEKDIGVESASLDAEARMRCVKERLKEYVKFLPKVSGDILLAAESVKKPGLLCDFIAANVFYKYEDKQAVLDEFDPLRRLELVTLIMEKEINVLKLEATLAEKVKENMDQNQRDYYLREQMKVIQEELGTNDDYSDVEEFLDRIEKAKLPEEMHERLTKEAKKLAKMPFGSTEASVISGYIDTCLEIPFGTYTEDSLDLDKAKKQLDRDHEGLEDVKERILEYLAVKKLAPHLGGQILCLIGPPGVGKTSVAASIAKTLGRKYARLSLGGVRDEADIRGHRKTYIGSMPGRFVHALTQAGSMNPLIVMDEIDKLTADAHGDPASALLEVLDPEQNHAFRDHYIEVPVDLSQCIFLATANNRDTIPRALIDRMEIIEVPGYTQGEKLAIAKNHLIPKQQSRHGLKKTNLVFRDEAILKIIDGYTREMGVRNLERSIARICRKAAGMVAGGTCRRLTVTEDKLEGLLGKERYRREEIEPEGTCGVVNGLAWTEAGGELLKIEVLSFPGTGKLELTGSLGDVMKESAHAAVSLIRYHAKDFGILDEEFYKNRDLPSHLPEGAIPKDGPSAGIALVTALVSELSGRAVRSDVAMTGEITLRGKVLAIGGLREKTSAAAAAGLTTVLIPKENERDLDKIDPEVRAALIFRPVSDITEVLALALQKAPLKAEEICPPPPAASDTVRRPRLSR